MSLIHRYQSNGYNIVLDINSGCIHLVDLVTYEVLPFMEEGLSEQEIVDKLKDQYPEADIRTSVSECEKLKEQGMLFTRDIYENIIDEFRATLNHKYAVAEDFENVYVYLRERLSLANMKKDKEILEEVLKHLRTMRDTWKEVMKETNNGTKLS